MMNVRSMFVLVWLVVISADHVVATEDAGKAKSPEEIKRLRKEAAHRKRRIIYDNDGNEPVYYCEKATAQALLERRTIGVVGSQVDTIVYCTWSSGFSMFTHNTKIGQVFTCTAEGFSKNKTKEFIEQGTDPLEIMVDFCRRKKIEVFWSMRMNDTHDAWGGWYSPYLFPQLKKDHPEYLVGSKEDKPRNGAWTAVDYGHQEIRDLAFKFVEEVCENYEVDGVMLDYFRHPLFFKRHGLGQPVGQEELDQMTSLVRRIRRMADRVGVERGRPILIAVRVPDSADYAKAIGLDIVRWMKEGLIDMLVVSGYFRLNPWETSVKLGHKYGVPVYPCLSETRLRDKEAKKVRASPACYRGRAMNVWASGADGVYMFNFFNPHSPLWREIGEAKTITPLERVYCTGARGVSALNRWFSGGQRFLNRSPVSPERSRKLKPGKPVNIELNVGEKFAEEDPPTITLRLRVAGLKSADDITVKVNDALLGQGSKSEACVEYTVDPKLVKKGVNQCEIMSKQADKTEPILLDLLLHVR